MSTDRFYLRQLLAGRDFGKGHQVATQMANFIYLVGDREAGECVVIDPAWDIAGVMAAAADDDMTLTGALITHWHPDHVGGPLMGFPVDGIKELLEQQGMPIYVNRADVEFVTKLSGVTATDLTAVDSHHVVKVGEVEIECLHTPGHTAGSQCFRCKSSLIAGDTLFLQGCGRLDLPGSDVDEMFRTMSERLATLPGDTVLYPGHNYGDRPHAPMDDVRRTNFALQVPDLQTWRRFMG